MAQKQQNLKAGRVLQEIIAGITRNVFDGTNNHLKAGKVLQETRNA